MARPILRFLAVAIAVSAAALLLTVSAPAQALIPVSSPSGNGSVVYTGTQHETLPQDLGSGPGMVTLANCVSGVCDLEGVSLQGSGTVTGVHVTKGRADIELAATGDLCSTTGSYSAPTTISVHATSTKIIVSVHSPEVNTVCPDGTTTSYYEDQWDFTGARSSGDPCLITGNCGAASGRAAASSSGPRGPATPSVLSALPVAWSAFAPRNVLWAVGAAVVLVLLIAFPTQLFNSAAERASDRAGRWWRRVRPAKAAPPATKPAVAWSGWPFAGLGVLAASIISVFVDPHVAIDLTSLRTLASILLSLILDVVIGWLAVVLIVRRTHPTATATFDFKPLTLFIVVVAVLFTRLTGFQPGIVFGLVAGLAFGSLVAVADKARVALIGLGYSFGVGLLAWIGYSIIAGAVARPGAGLVFVQEALSSAAIAGIAALPIALLPLRGLTGFTVWEWRKPVWIAAYAVGLFAFMLVLMPMPSSWQTVPLSLWTWIALFALYAIVAVVAWLLAARPWRREAPSASAASGH